MAQGGTASVLRRKAGQGRAAAAAAVPAGPAKALADAIRRAAEEELSLAVVPGEPQQRRATPDEIVEGLPEHAFLALLIGPEDGAGLVALDPAALSAVLEMRTMGRVTSRAPATRRPTATDAAMVADVIDRILAEFETPLMTGEEARWASGWRYQMFLPESRPVPIVLEDAQHRVLEVEVLFGAAAKPGRILIALPATGRAQPRPAEPPPRQSAKGRAAAAWQRAIGEAVESSEVTLGTVLGRIRLTLADLSGLAPGDRIALPVAALGAVRLTGPGGAVVGAGRLGQTGGLRALKLSPPDSAPAPPATGEIIPAGTLGQAGSVAMAAFGEADPGGFQGIGASRGTADAGGARSEAALDPFGNRSPALSPDPQGLLPGELDPGALDGFLQGLGSDSGAADGFLPPAGAPDPFQP